MTDQPPKNAPATADRYRELFENSADAFLIIEHGKFVDCNQAAANMLGYEDKNALLQRHPSDISPEFQRDGKRSFEKANEILAGFSSCRNQRFEWDHVKSDGSILPVEVSMTAIPADDGYTLHIVWRDLSEQKRLENELRQIQKMEALGNLAGGIAHDFNNLLGPIVTYSELLAHSLKDNPKPLQWAQEISRAGMLAASMVKKLLAVSRQDDRLPITLDLEETVEESLEMLRTLIGEDVEVLFSATGRPLWVETDPGDVEQILLNLASNARDALPSGGSIHLTLSEVRRSRARYARLEFKDNGMGMDRKTLEQMYVPFFTTKELGRGTGLGMSSVHELVTKAKGQISAESSLGSGTTIELLLPIAGHKDPKTLVSETGTKAPQPTATADTHILVVEDDPHVMRMICEVLDQGGFRISTARNGADALKSLETELPDLILADVVMPQMNGPKMVRAMNNNEVFVPVVFLSGYTDDRLTAQGFDPSHVTLIRKPFTASALLKHISNALGLEPHGISGS